MPVPPLVVGVLSAVGAAAGVASTVYSMVNAPPSPGEATTQQLDAIKKQIAQLPDQRTKLADLQKQKADLQADLAGKGKTTAQIAADSKITDLNKKIDVLIGDIAFNEKLQAQYAPAAAAAAAETPATTPADTSTWASMVSSLALENEAQNQLLNKLAQGQQTSAAATAAGQDQQKQVLLLAAGAGALGLIVWLAFRKK